MIDIFIFVIVKLAPGDDLARHRRLRLIVAEDRDLELACIDAALDEDLVVEAQRERDGGIEIGIARAPPRIERKVGVARITARARENLEAALRRDEASVFGDADRNDRDARLRRGVRHRPRRENRDIVLGAAPAEDQCRADHLPSGMLPSRYFRSSSRQRIPPPNVNATSLSGLSTPAVTKMRGVFGVSSRSVYSP